MQVALRITETSSTAVGVVHADIHVSLGSPSAHVGRQICDGMVIGNAAGEHKILLVARPVADQLNEPSIFDLKVEWMPAGAENPAFQRSSSRRIRSGRQL
jgi:hypothetical protein